MMVVIPDMSIKNHVAMSIAHIYVHNMPIIKTLHYTINITYYNLKLELRLHLGKDLRKLKGMI